MPWRFASSGFNCAGSEFAQSLRRHLGEAFHRRRQLRCSRAESDREPLGFTALYDREQIAAGSQCRRPVRCVSYGLLCWKPHTLDIRNQFPGDLSAQLTANVALLGRLRRACAATSESAGASAGVAIKSYTHYWAGDAEAARKFALTALRQRVLRRILRSIGRNSRR